MEASDLPFGLCCRLPAPLPDRPEPRRVIPCRSAVFAGVDRRIRVLVRPTNLTPLERLMLTAVGARHKELALVALAVGRFDPAGTLIRRRADQDDLAVPERAGSLLGQRHRVALGACADRISVNLVAQDDPARARRQAGRAVGPAGRHMSASKGLVQRRVAAVPRPRIFDLVAQHRRVTQARGQTVLRPCLRHLQRRLHHQHGGRVLVDVIADDVVDQFRLADLRACHQNDSLNVGIRHSVHHPPLVFGPRC